MHGAGYRHAMSVTKALRIAGLIDTSHSSQEAMDRGTAIHAALEYADQDDLEMDGLPEFIGPYLDAWTRMKLETGARIVEVEVAINDDTYRYSGRADRIVVIGEHRGVLDIKSGAAAPWHALQTAAYAQGDPAVARWTCYLTHDGTYRLVRHTDRNDWQKFLAALSVAKMRVEWGLAQEDKT